MNESRYLLGLVGSTTLICLLGGGARRLVRKNAPFYAAKNILTVGASFGAATGFIVHFLTKFVGNSSTSLILLGLWGVLSNLYIGYKPDPIDWAKKTQQTSYFAVATYILVAGCLSFLN